jgi:hypothetical protein
MRSYEAAKGLPAGTAQQGSIRRQPEQSVSEGRTTMMKQNKPQENKPDNDGKRRGVPSKTSHRLPNQHWATTSSKGNLTHQVAPTCRIAT